MKFRELFARRVEEGAISNTDFAKLLERAKAEFVAQHGKPRRRRGKPSKPLKAEDAPLPDFDLEEFRL